MNYPNSRKELRSARRHIHHIIAQEVSNTLDEFGNGRHIREIVRLLPTA